MTGNGQFFLTFSLSTDQSNLALIDYHFQGFNRTNSTFIARNLLELNHSTDDYP